MPPFLADSLPDAWGNQVFECWRIQNNIRNQDITPLDLLSFIGKRGMGALEFMPEGYYTEVLKNARKSAGITQQQLADKIGKKREYVAMPEKGETDMQLSTFIMISEAVGLKFALTY